MDFKNYKLNPVPVLLPYVQYWSFTHKTTPGNCKLVCQYTKDNRITGELEFVNFLRIHNLIPVSYKAEKTLVKSHYEKVQRSQTGSMLSKGSGQGNYNLD